MRSLIKNNRGQIWVETVIYTLIGLSVIGILLAVATPKINEMKDRLRLNEAIDILLTIDSKINDVKSAPSNVRVYDLTIAKGKVIIDATDDSISWIIESNLRYSEPGTVLPQMGLEILTEGDGFYKITLRKKFDFDLKVDNSVSDIRTLETSPSAYALTITNQGYSGGRLQIDISAD
jgi:type II secretory pathway pseudopilin PulG